MFNFYISEAALDHIRKETAMISTTALLPPPSLLYTYNVLSLRPTNIGLSSFYEEQQFSNLVVQNYFKTCISCGVNGFQFSLLLVLLRRFIVPTLGRDVKHTCLQDFLILQSVETSSDLNSLKSLEYVIVFSSFRKQRHLLYMKVIFCKLFSIT